MKLAVIAAFVMSASIISAQVLPGRDAFVVRSEAKVLSNGVQLLPSALLVERPAVDKCVPGVVVVKTRGTYGIQRNEQSIVGSSVNSLLSSVRIANISSTYPTPPNATDADIQLASEIGLDRVYTIRYADATNPFDLCLRLMGSPDVEYAVPMELHTMNTVPNDPLYAEQTWMKTMKMEEAWDISQGSATVVIGIVDSGTDWTHEDLVGKIKMNTGEIAGNGKDDDGNGFIDDIRGWDFVGNITMQEAYQGIFKPDNDPKVTFPTINGTNGHGTLTAGCAGANTNNSTGIASTGYKCLILPVKVASDDPSIGGLLAGYQGIKYAADNGAQIINCSWGGTSADPSGQDVINYCLSKGVLVVTASGNEGTFTEEIPHYPSSFTGVLAVGASTSSDTPAGFSNYGYDVHVYAEGTSILSTFPGNKYQKFDGTSFSCPLVAGLCGLIKSKHPDWTPEMITQQLRSTCDPLKGVAPGSRPLYYGRVNARSALKYNDSFSSGDRIPGITLSALIVGGSGQITTYDPTNVTIVLKNYLGDATDVKISVKPLGSGTEVSGGNTSIPVLLHDSSTSVNLVVRLLPTYPWYEANQQFLVTIQSGAYENYAMVHVPVKLPSTNQFTGVNQSAYLTFDLVDFTNDGTLWATGAYLGTPAMITGNQSGPGGMVAVPFAPVCVYAVSSNTVMIGGVATGTPNIAITRNANTWTKTDMSPFMSSIAGIGMVDAQTGFAVGNPVGGKIGMAKTTDGGNTWSKVPNALTANTGETILPNVVFSNANGFWFTTSSRRVISTLNRGASWSSAVLSSVGAVIKSIAVDDKMNGAIVYSDGSENQVALSAGGGAWVPKAVDLASLDISAAAVGSPGKHLVLVGLNGEILGSDNAGKDWQVILSKEPGLTLHAVARNAGATVVATSGDNLGVLVYKYSGPNGTKILSMVSDSVDYGTLQSGQNRLRTVRVESMGESNVTINSTVITPYGATPADAFRIISPLDSIIAPGTTQNLGIRLYATDTGTYTGSVTITSNAQPGSTITAALTGVVTPITSVLEVDIARAVQVYPNPITDAFTVMLPEAASAELVNIAGERVRSYGMLEQGSQELSAVGLAPGSYRLLVVIGNKHLSIPLMRMP